MSHVDPLAVSLALVAAAHEVERMRAERDRTAASRDYWIERTAEAEDAYGDAAEMLARGATERDRALEALEMAVRTNGEALALIWSAARDIAARDRSIDACADRIAELLDRGDGRLMVIRIMKRTARSLAEKLAAEMNARARADLAVEIGNAVFAEYERTRAAIAPLADRLERAAAGEPPGCPMVATAASIAADLRALITGSTEPKETP